MKALESISLIKGWLPISLFILTGLSLIILLCSKSIFNKKKKYIIPTLIKLGITFIAFLIGLLIIWLISDVFLIFGVSLGWLVNISIAIGISLIAFSITSAVLSKGLKRIFAIFTIILVLLSTLVQVDIIYGEYTTIGSIFGLGGYPKLEKTKKKSSNLSIAQWKELAKKHKLPTIPKNGITRSVKIPAPKSHFNARIANVYLPPAALVKNPPKLPVMVMLAGQPGSPNRFFSASDIVNTLDDFAKKHNGLAPIVISPDQNGDQSHNSLCADTNVYGKAETYLTKDVPNWIIKNLTVDTNPNFWMMGGFSQGGTCSTQLVPAHPDIYGNIFAAGGELEPTYKNRLQTINRYFNGNTKAYENHVPVVIMSKKAPLNQYYYSIAGQWDLDSQKNQNIISKAAHKAGMNVITMIAKSHGHDWYTVKAGLQVAIDRFSKRTGISDTLPPLYTYSDIKIVKSENSETRIKCKQHL